MPLTIKNKKISVSLELDGNGNVVEINNISSIHSKDAIIELSRLAKLGEDGLKKALRWVEKEKVLNWFGIADLFSPIHTDNPELSLVAKVVQDHKNPKIYYKKNISDTQIADIDNPSARLSLVEDRDEIERLENEELVPGYRNVVMNAGGDFGSPMAGTLGNTGRGKERTLPFSKGVWEKSDERPWLADENGKINLGKPDGLGNVDKVDYNPYIHIRPNMVNKQFKNANG